MKIEDRITKMKKIYQGTSVPDYEVIKEWQVLENVLGEQQKSFPTPLLFRTFAFLTIILLLSSGVVSLAQAAKPGELLYPVKEFSQKVVKEIKKSSPVFTNTQSIQPTDAPTVTPQQDTDDGKDVKGVMDEKEKNIYDEKNEDKKSDDVKGQSFEQKVETRNGDNNNSGSDNNDQRNKSESGKKESSLPANSDQAGSKKVENNGSESSDDAQDKNSSQGNQGNKGKSSNDSPNK